MPNSGLPPDPAKSWGNILTCQKLDWHRALVVGRLQTLYSSHLWGKRRRGIARVSSMMGSSTPMAIWASCAPTTSMRPTGQWGSGDMPSIYEPLEKKARRTVKASVQLMVGCFGFIKLIFLIPLLAINEALGIVGSTFWPNVKQVNPSKSCTIIPTSSPSRTLETWNKPQHSSSRPSRMKERTSALASTRPSMSQQTLGWHGINRFHQKHPFWPGLGLKASHSIEQLQQWGPLSPEPQHCRDHLVVSSLPCPCPRTRHNRWRVQKKRLGVGEWQGIWASRSLLYSLDCARLNGLQHFRATNVSRLAQDVPGAFFTDLTYKTLGGRGRRSNKGWYPDF